ncbi:PaaI family thioesterase [Microbaculum marinum]|uniref:PaaI family thioesterase n=1 Tax=Microbaculum marinum TaxID=1764581 RepID=A0AAW9RLC9_9HYPH
MGSDASRGGNDFGVREGQQLLADVFAPWVQELGLKVASVGASVSTFTMPGGARFVRSGGAGGGVICGQAVSAAADTASVVALSGLNGRFRACTTVDQTVHFMRPLPDGEVEIRVEALSNGRRMAVTRVEFRPAGSDKVGAAATCAFAYLED